MNKSLIYTFICELEQELKELLSNNRFSELILCEIINDAIITMHEVGNSSKSDEDTAKGFVILSIERFYTPKYLQAVEDKYWNWDKRLHHGFRGRILPTPDNLLRFRMSVDTTRKEVDMEKKAMLHAVSTHDFKSKIRKYGNIKLNIYKIIISVAVFLLIAISIVFYALNNRYLRMDEEIVFDKWTGKNINVFEQQQ